MDNKFGLPRKHKVIFKGSLKKFGEFEIAGYTAADCIRGVATQIPELYTTIMNGYFKVRHVKNKFKENLTMEMATREIFNYNEQQTIEVIPVVQGATGDKNGDTILAGAGLVIGGILLGVLTMGASWAATPILWTTAGALVSSLATTMVITGLSLVFGGIAGLVAKQDEEKEEETKYSFSGPSNINKQGVAIPLIYGKVGVGSNMVSSLMGKIYGTPEMPAGEYSNGVSGSIRLTDLLGEGEIVGLVDGEKSVLLDGVPLVREDGTKTYPNTSVTFCTGVNNPKDPYAEGVNTPIDAGGQFEDRVWQTFTVVDPKTDRVNINLKFNALYYQDNSDGHTDMLTTWFEVQVAGEDLVWQNASFNTGGNKLEYECVEQTIYSKSTVVGEPMFISPTEIWWQSMHEWNWIDCEGNPQKKTEFVDYSPVVANSLPLTVKARQTKQTQTSSFSLGSFSVRAETKTTLDLTIQIDVGGLDRTKPRYFRIRQIKTIPDDNSYYEDCQLIMYSEQIDIKMNYEGRAVVYMALNAQDFQGKLPSRIYEVKGLIIDVPSNYDPEARTYDGIWDGTFKKAWTNNPVWVFYDLLTNVKYGLGRSISKENVDKWSLYYASMYCDELVSDGNGGREPRFTFNGVINSREQAFDVIMNVAGVFRSMVYAGNGQIFLAQDAPRNIKRTFGNVNVIGGMFNYEGSAATARHTAIEVTWINPDNTWQSEKEIYEDGALIEKYGYNVKSVVATGCTSRGQAQRIARHAIYTEEYENDTVTFQVGLMDCDIRPGDIIYIQDEMIAGEVLMGTIKELSTQTIVLDRPVKMSVGNTYTIMMTDINGKNYVKNLVNREMETDTLWIRSDEFFTQEQVEEFYGASFWTLISDEVKPVKYRVLSIAEEADEGGAKFTITALLHYDEKYALIDENISFERPPISSQPQGELRPPVTFQAIQSLKKVEGSVVASVDCSWGLPSDVRVSSVEVKIKYPNSQGFVDYGLLRETKLNIENVGVGEMRAKLRSYSDMTKTYSQEVEFFAELDSPYVNPPKPMNLTGETVAGVGVFKWDKPQYAFPLHYEYYFITPDTTDQRVTTTNNSASISRAFNKYPATVSIYVRSINEVDMMSDWAKTSISVTPADLEIGDFLEDIDDSWLTGDSQQMLGSGGLLEQISTALLHAEAYMVYRVARTDSELAIAVEGLSALTEDHKALASKVTFLNASVGEQLTSDDPDKFNLKWYDGSDPDYPETPNPLYKKDEPLSVTNYPYLPVFPQNSMAGYIMEVYSGDDFVKGQITNDLRVEFQGVTSEIKEEMVTVVNDKGEAKTNYTVRLDGVNREGQPIIGGFGLHSDGYNTSFGVNAHTFWIRDPNWQEGDNPYDEYVFVTDVQHNITYIGTNNTIFKGKVQSLSYLEDSKEGFSLDPETNTFELNAKDLRFRIDNTGHNKWFKRNGVMFDQIVDIGQTDSNGYSYALNVDVSKFKNSGALFKAKSQPYRLSVLQPRSNETSCINVSGGNVGIRDITNQGMTLRTTNKEKAMYVTNYKHRQNCFLQFNPITCKVTWDGDNSRLDFEIARVVATFYVFMRDYLNDRIDAEVGSMVMLPNPFTMGFPEQYSPVSSHSFQVEEHCLWLKTQRRTSINDAGQEYDVIQKDMAMNVWGNDISGNNRYYGYLPLNIAGWERITGPKQTSKITNYEIYSYNPGGDREEEFRPVINNINSYYKGRIFMKEISQKEIDAFATTGYVPTPYSIIYT